MSAKADCSYSLWLERELRSDHAGETGAVWIYRGVLATRPELALRQFCLRHLGTEKRHLEKMNTLLEPKARSALLPLWRAAGFLTGFFSGCLGQRAVYQTIAAVETFVQEHYQQQIDHAEIQDYPDIRATLQACMDDEIEHKSEATELAGVHRGKFLQGWCALVGAGSSIAVDLARRF
jgi:ubiquinone biosynthesis monooxygenase Coq7